MEVISDHLSTQYLSKNTSGIIIGYLTDPPPLPFVEELTFKTAYIKRYTDTQWYYDRYYRDQVYLNFSNKIIKIYRNLEEWCMKW